MDVSARGVLSREVRAALDAHLDDRMLNGATDKDAFFALVERARGRFAELIGAEADEIAFTKNISDGLNIDRHRDPLAPRRQRRALPGARASQQRLRVAEPPALRRRSAHGPGA